MPETCERFEGRDQNGRAEADSFTRRVAKLFASLMVCYRGRICSCGSSRK